MPNIKQSLENIAEYIGGKVADRESIFRVQTIPEASANNLNEIIQYLGPTTEYYIRGYFYKCTYEDDQYIWLRHDVQSRAGGGEIVVSVPNISVGTYTYNEELQGPSFLGLDPGRCTITDQKKINAGQYTMSIALNDTTNMKWADGSTAPKVCNYEIEKVPQTISVTTTTVEVNADNPIYTIPVTGVKGTLTATSSNQQVATADVDGDNVVITGVKNGNATITIVVPEDTNCYGSNTITVSVSASMLKIGGFGTLTDEELVELVAAADRGEIDLYEDAGWRVGDERVVTLDAMSASGVGESHVKQSVTFVLMHKGGYNLANSTSSGRTTCSFVVGLKNSLLEKGYMNSTRTNNGSWGSTARRTWCNEVFYFAIPLSLRPIFKQSIVYTINPYNGSSMAQTTDYFFLPAIKEVAGVGGNYENATESSNLFQLDYYKTHNIRKMLGDSASTYFNYYTRSPHKSANAIFLAIGGASPYYNATSYANDVQGIAPIGCI